MTWPAQDQSNIHYARKRAHCGKAFTQYEEIRHLRGKLKAMTEATCQVDYAENWEVDYGLCKYVDEIGSVCYDNAQISIDPMVLHYTEMKMSI